MESLLQWLYHVGQFTAAASCLGSRIRNAETGLIQALQDAGVATRVVLEFEPTNNG